MKQHPMIRALQELHGNPKACVLTEPLFGIPNSLYVPFASVYMLALGVSDVQVGLVASLLLFVRAGIAMISGVVTDKLGRKRTTLIFDIIAWSIPCLLWAFAQNVWWFYAAALLNGFWQLTDNSWTCLLVEDAEKRMIVHIYSWVYVSGQLSVFFAPLSSLLVGGLTIIPALRILYFFSFVSMTAKFILLDRYCDETKVGKIRLQETHGKSLLSVLSEYRELVPRFFRSGDMRLATGISVLLIVANMVMDNFFGIYTTQRLGMPDYYLAYFPIIRSAIMLLFLFFIQPRLFRFGFKGPMLVGVTLYIVSHLLLILLPSIGAFRNGSALVPVLYTVLQACAHGLVMPRRDSIVALSLDPLERARMTSIMTVVMLSVTIPFGYIAGFLSSVNRNLPFILNIALFAIAFAIVLTSRKLRKGGDLEARESL